MVWQGIDGDEEQCGDEELGTLMGRLACGPLLGDVLDVAARPPIPMVWEPWQMPPPETQKRLYPGGVSLWED